jgi:tetratricopeptide (TPR) repeat protein
MKIAFNTPGRRWLVAIACLSVGLACIGLAATQFAAYWFGSHADLTSLNRAARLDPGNADYRNRLGRYYDIVSRDPAAAVAQYKKAVGLNPHSARYWFDLASVYQVLGDISGQTNSLERAIAAEPTKPDVAWTAANFYLVQGENEKALREFRVVLANDATLAAAAIQYCWRIEPDVDLLLRDIVPPSGDAYGAFLTYLQIDTAHLLREVAQLNKETDTASQTEIQDKLAQAAKETAATFKVWNAWMQSRQPFERRQAFDYFRFLIERKEVDQAVLVWQHTVSHFGYSSYYLPSSGNLIVNGGFSLDPLNAGLDWQFQKQGGVELTLDPTTFHSGQRSFMITFDGPGISDAGVGQLIPVQPNTAYNFSAYYKTSEQQGAGGPHFTIQDVYSKAIYYESEELKEAGFWKSADGEFTTSPDCKLVILHVRRLPEHSPIRGKLWIDDLRLTRKPS